MIVDFAASDERDAVQNAREEACEDHRRAEEKRTRLAAAMAQREQQFTHEMADRLRRATRVYHQQLDKLERDLDRVRPHHS